MIWRLWQVLAVLYTVLSLTFVNANNANKYISSDHVVKTKLGRIRGVPQNFEGKKVTAFLGVPYGQPPTKKLRFSNPKMVLPWKGIKDATTPAQPCFHFPDSKFKGFRGSEMWNPKGNMTEDCLNMNIWVPHDTDGSVIVWIFGGGFFTGSPSLDVYNGTALAAKKRTIVVNINYRLGPFGFLFLGDNSPAEGNMGLQDQQVALRWVHKHISSFGGNPKRVTLFGEASGAASATAHLAAPGSYEFFDKIIGNGGTIMNSWASRTNTSMLELSMKLAERLNCTKKGKKPTIVHRCMVEHPAHVVLKEAAVVSYQIGLVLTFAFIPITSDKNFFRGNVFDRLRDKDIKKNVSIVLGTVKDEATFFLPYYFGHNGFSFNNSFSADGKENMALINISQYNYAMNATAPFLGKSLKPLLEAYKNVSKRKTEGERLRDGVGRFMGDYFYTCNVIDFANIVSNIIDGPLYMYYFTKRSVANPWPEWMGKQLENETIFSRNIMSFWKHFIKTGAPAIFWPKYDRMERKALVLGEESVKDFYPIMTNVHGSYCKLIEKAKASTNNGTVKDSISKDEITLVMKWTLWEVCKREDDRTYVEEIHQREDKK
ncbi:Carboxylesterase [Necator americanus]|uniref:Carboxylesterase n=1 Tax=Necator americanus TaxID=51031 RepID=W2TKF7_NECAM|nr:Carboxylesterase [Necator americanus]ETN81492.1 Carboxylesterase [Necator americanus]